MMLLFHQCCFLLIGVSGKEWIVDGCHLCVVSLCFLPRLSSTSVEFNFSASLNDVAPASPMLFSVDLLVMRVPFVCCFFLCSP